jgi:hypothetical protein
VWHQFWVFGLILYSSVVCLQCKLQAKGQTSFSRSEEGEVQSARRGSSYFAFRIQFMEEQQIFKRMVL